MGNCPNAAAHAKPMANVIATLVKVPKVHIQLASVLVFSEVPKRNIDLAAIRKPMAEN